MCCSSKGSGVIARMPPSPSCVPFLSLASRARISSRQAIHWYSRSEDALSNAFSGCALRHRTNAESSPSRAKKSACARRGNKWR
ncbi:hypothetical protein AB1Y20_001898 [Prymnesium parvum]|uniref:Secreted protein n=1 Tax=Prymnesium parvum TaxID=97485 RepID=A0AB34J9L6_PRYPA